MFWPIMARIVDFPITVEHPCATTSRKRPPIQSINIFPVNSLHLEPLVDDRDHMRTHENYLWQLETTLHILN